MSYGIKKAAVLMRRMNPDVAGNVLTDIAHRHGKVTGRILLDEATDPNHPLHSLFEWSDRKCGEIYRLMQANQIIRSVVLDTQSAAGREVRAFVRVEELDPGVGIGPGYASGAYQPIGDVLSDPTLRRQMLDRAMQDFQNFQSRYSVLNELAELFELGKVIAKRHGFVVVSGGKKSAKKK